MPKAKSLVEAVSKGYLGEERNMRTKVVKRTLKSLLGLRTI